MQYSLVRESIEGHLTRNHLPIFCTGPECFLFLPCRTYGNHFQPSQIVASVNFFPYFIIIQNQKINLYQLGGQFCIVSFYLLQGRIEQPTFVFQQNNKIMINLSITGTKYVTTSIVPKTQDSLVIQSKLTSIKSSQPKPAVIKKQKVQIKNKAVTSKIIATQNKINIKPTQSAKDNRKQDKTAQTVNKEQPKQEETIKKQEVIVPAPKIQDKIGEVIVRYNHYKDKFETRNDILHFQPIQQKYCFSGVFKGNFIPVIKNYKTNEEVNPETIGRAVQFSWKVENQVEYRLQIQQDEQQQAKYQKKPYIAPKSEQKCQIKRNSQIEYITEQLKKLKPEEYGSAKHKQLLQQRDLQDLLFS